MFGYVRPAAGELLVREYEFYKSCYCGICRAMKKHTGWFSNCTLSYDSVFLALVRMCYVKDADIRTGKHVCGAHPCKKKCMLEENPALAYTARAFAVLTYYKMKDDLSDEPFGKRLLCAFSRPVLSHARKKADLPELECIAREKLAAIDALGHAGCPSADQPAALFGELLGEVFACGLDDGDRLVPYEIGRTLGRFIYLADAAEDYEKDRRSGAYNPFVLSYEGRELTEENRATLRTALCLAGRDIESAVNLLPYGRRRTLEDIIQNIVCLGLKERLAFLDPPAEKKEEPNSEKRKLSGHGSKGQNDERSL